MQWLNPLAKLLAAASIALVVGCSASPQREPTGAHIDDAMITARVKTAILSEPTLKSMEINVETYKGRVQLSGFVSTQANASTAVAAARGVTGVLNVQDAMRLK